VLLVLTHDVDWGFKGPGVKHILDRRDRFESHVIDRVVNEGFNPYFGVPYVVEVEERLGVRSTFFFRSFYDDSSTVVEYEGVVKDLERGGWEVGLHFNSVDVESIQVEKKLLESLGVRIYGCRGHYLRVPKDGVQALSGLGFLYDSSLMPSPRDCSSANAGFIRYGNFIEFPVTLMDAYLFTYNKLSEDIVIPYIVECLNRLKNLGVHVATILWHDSSILMKGGRVYPKLLEELMAKFEDMEFVRGIDAYRKVLRCFHDV